MSVTLWKNQIQIVGGRDLFTNFYKFTILESAVNVYARTHYLNNTIIELGLA